VREGKLTAGHARTLIGAPDAEARAKEIVEGAFNVRQAEQRSGKVGAKAKPRPEKDADTKALELSLSNRLGLKVQILDKGDKGGELKIIYSTLEQLDDVIHRLNTAR
jgi:ParB family chromosome partitioning protein